jgi:hypothetical protein
MGYCRLKGISFSWKGLPPFLWDSIRFKKDRQRINRYENSCLFWRYDLQWLITVAARSKAWTAFARLNTGIVGSNPSRRMDVSVRLFYVCVVLCVGSGLATGSSPVQGVLPTVYRIKKLKSGQGPKNYRTIERERERENDLELVLS